MKSIWKPPSWPLQKASRPETEILLARWRKQYITAGMSRPDRDGSINIHLIDAFIKQHSQPNHHAQVGEIPQSEDNGGQCCGRQLERSSIYRNKCIRFGFDSGLMKLYGKIQVVSRPRQLIKPASTSGRMYPSGNISIANSSTRGMAQMKYCGESTLDKMTEPGIT